MDTPKKKQRIVITGGNGFIGTILIDHLLAEGYRNIVNISRSPRNTNNKIKNVLCDLSKNKTVLETLIQKGDVIIHLAWGGIVFTSEQNREKDIRNNLIGTLSLLQVCAKKNIKKIIFLSSGGTVYGNSKQTPSKESDICTPKSSYGLLKRVAEEYIELFGYLYGIKYTIIRLANAYGRTITDENPRWALDIFVKKAKDNSPIVINGDGNTTRDYIHISDAINFIIKTIKDGKIVGIYNLGTGIGTSLNKIISIIENISGKKLSKKYQGKNNYDLDYNVLNISKALKTGWRPKIAITEGIRQTYKKSKYE